MASCPFQPVKAPTLPEPIRVLTLRALSTFRRQRKRMEEDRTVLLLRLLHLQEYSSKLESHCLRFLKPWESGQTQEAFLASHGPSVRAVFVSGLAPVDEALIGSLPSLGIVVTTSAGLDHIDLAACRRRGIIVTNAGDLFTVDAADYAIGLLIDVLRKISASDRLVRQGLWKLSRNLGCPSHSSRVGGKRVGIVGLGRIGLAIARRLEAFDCIIAYTSRTKKPTVPFTYFANVRELAAASDILVLACSLTEKSRHIVNQEVLSALGKKGVVINIGRGSLIDEKELVSSLAAGEIAGAGLDVFQDEHNVPTELFGMDNVVLSPHAAVLTTEALNDVSGLCVANLIAFFENKPLLNVVES